MPLPWICAMTKPNAESIAAINLRRQGYACYYPRYLSKRPGKHGFLVSSVRPLFPRYIFILIDQVWYSLLGTRGISKLLMGEGGGPGHIAGSIIERLRQREDKNGLYQLTAPPRFSLGAKVKCEDGPFAGMALCYEGQAPHDRVKVLASLLGRQVSIEMSESELIAA